MRAPRVNQMRFFSSSALAIAPKLIFAASCSAAEAIVVSPKYLNRDGYHANGGHAILTRAAAWILVNVGAGSRLRNATQQGDRATSLLDRFDGRLGRACNLEGELRLELADAEDLHAVARLGDHTGSHQRLDRAGADTTADAHAVLGRTFVVTNFVEFHDALLTARRQRARGA